MITIADLYTHKNKFKKTFLSKIKMSLFFVILQLFDNHYIT